MYIIFSNRFQYRFLKAFSRLIEPPLITTSMAYVIIGDKMHFRSSSLVPVHILSTFRNITDTIRSRSNLLYCGFVVFENILQDKQNYLPLQLVELRFLVGLPMLIFSIFKRKQSLPINEYLQPLRTKSSTQACKVQLYTVCAFETHAFPALLLPLVTLLINKWMTADFKPARWSKIKHFSKRLRHDIDCEKMNKTSQRKR